MPAPAPSPCAARFELARVPLLAPHGHAGRLPGEPDLVVRAHRPAPEMDVVVHFHGYSGRGARMRLVHDKEPHCGLDYCNPEAPAEPGRARPTLGLLPRGRFFGGRTGMGYDFPALTRPGGLDALVDLALAEAARRFGLPRISPARLILTGHSGGGAPIMLVLGHLGGRPDEVHVFDGLYGGPSALVRWMSASLARDLTAARALRGQGVPPDAIRRHLASRGGALRVVFRRDGPRSTEPSSLRVAAALESALRSDPVGAALVCPFYRVEQTTLGHNAIPRAVGFRLLRDAGADLPRARPVRPLCRPVAPGAAAAAGP